MAKIPEATLNSGHKIPLLGLGTAVEPRPPSELVTSIILTAIEVGYRHFDTAAAYETERPLGAAIAEALRRGLVKSREELFITSKLWCRDGHPDLVLPALQKTLENLGLEYVDLYLIHWPVSLKKASQGPSIRKEDILVMDVKSVWEVMEECSKLGLAKSIGVSNFTCKKLQDLLAAARIPPAVNQVEMNTGWQQKKLMGFCKEKGIHVSAWSPLGANGALWGSLNVMGSSVLKEIAEAKGKSVAQVALRWLHQQGVSIVVKSFNEKRMEENMEIFDWELTEDEVKKIGESPQGRGFSGDVFVSPLGPFKTVEDLWDGEV
ncbi:non-functional NADPH-dependent codeinone reductase 2-like isoform X1 [Aristolochia californica]|uniref:non-functional NADPH-dependent codeinone reductase 2-like isoform X1 n=1 Tax=Aristolochia californica TaxID=171875 RepID=UPI0035E0010E